MTQCIKRLLTQLNLPYNMKTFITESEKKDILIQYGLIKEDFTEQGYTFKVINGKIQINGVNYTVVIVRGSTISAKANISTIEKVNDTYKINGSVNFLGRSIQIREVLTSRAKDNILTGVKNKEKNIYVQDYDYNGIGLAIRLITKENPNNLEPPKQHTPSTPVTTTPETPTITKTDEPVVKEDEFENIIQIAEKQGISFPSKKVYKDPNGVDSITLEMDVDISEKEKFFCKITKYLIHSCKSYDPSYQSIANTIKVTT